MFGARTHKCARTVSDSVPLQVCENCQQQSCKAFIGLTNRAKIIIVPEILDQSDRVGAKSPIFDQFSLVARQPQHLMKTVQLTLIGSPLRAFQ